MFSNFVLLEGAPAVSPIAAVTGSDWTRFVAIDPTFFLTHIIIHTLLRVSRHGQQAQVSHEIARSQMNTFLTPSSIAAELRPDLDPEEACEIYTGAARAAQWLSGL